MRVILLLSAVMLSACFHHETKEINVSSLDGLWYGKQQTAPGMIERISLEISEAQVVSATAGTMPVNPGSKITQATQNTFELSLQNSVHAVIVVDLKAEHMVLVNENNVLAVLQRTDGPGLAYSEADLMANWSGYSVIIETPLAIPDQFHSSSRMFAAPAGINVEMKDVKGNATGTVFIEDAGQGKYSGLFENPTLSISGSIEILVSDDREFSIGRACENQQVSFSTCTYVAWNRLVP